MYAYFGTCEGYCFARKWGYRRRVHLLSITPTEYKFSQQIYANICSVPATRVLNIVRKCFIFFKPRTFSRLEENRVRVKVEVVHSGEGQKSPHQNRASTLSAMLPRAATHIGNSFQEICTYFHGSCSRLRPWNLYFSLPCHSTEAPRTAEVLATSMEVQIRNTLGFLATYE